MTDKKSAAESPENLRKKPRLETNQDVTIYDAIREKNLGRLVNIHEEGLMLISGTEIIVNHLYQFELHFSNPILGTEKIKLGAECLWINETGADDHFWAGFQIIDLNSADSSVISELVKQIQDD